MRKLAVNQAGALAITNSTFLQGKSSRVPLIHTRRPER